MGCVQSHENKHRINQPLNHNNKSRQPQRRLVSGSNTNAPPVLISHHINGGSEVKRSAFPTPQNQKIEGNGNEKEKPSSSGIEGVHFQRQSFDRNSCLRKSSKRTRKNSAASANTSTTANGSVTTSPRNTKWSTEAKDVNVPLPVSVSANTAPLEASLDPPQPVCKTDENLSSHRHQQPQSTKNGLNGLNDEASPVTSLTSPQSQGVSEPPQRGDFSASANVAALLGIKPQVTSASEQQPLWEQPPAEEQWLFHPASPSFHIGDHTHSALPPQTTAATMTTFEAIQTAAAARSASSNGFSMMSASEVAKRDMIKKITATASTTGPTTATVAAIKSRRSSAPLASAASNSTDHRNRKSRKTSVPIPPAPPPRASSTGISSATPTPTASTATSSSLRTRREAAAATEREKVFREKEAHVEEEELEDCGRLI